MKPLSRSRLLHLIVCIYSIVFLLFYVACNRVVLREREVIIKKDTSIITERVRIDTLLQTLTDTIRKRNIIISYSFDTIKKRAKIYVETRPETIKIHKTYVKELKEIKKAPKQKEIKRLNLWQVGILSGLIAVIIFFLFRLLLRFFTKFV